MSEVIKRECGIDKILAYDTAQTLLILSGQYKETQNEYGLSVIVPCEPWNSSSSSSTSETSISFDAVGSSVSQARANESDCSKSNQKDMIVWKPPDTRQQDLIKIGISGRTWMMKEEYDRIKFNDYKKALRKLLTAVFGSRTLATHTRSGKTCPIYKKNTGRKVKPPLPEVPVNDIKIEIRKYFNGLAEELINECITIKCADEGRKYKNTEATGPEEE